MTGIKPINSPEDYENALKEIEALWGAKLGTPKGDLLDVLATLIDVYETKKFPMDAPDPIEAVKFRMEQCGLTHKDLEPILGSRMRVSEVLGRTRGLSITMIRKLHGQLGIPAEILIRPSVRTGRTVRKRVTA
jgi:HTH-type transcriptional regulator/antitoxin HigA